MSLQIEENLKSCYEPRAHIDFEAGWNGNKDFSKKALKESLPKYSVTIKQGARTIRTMGTARLDLLATLEGLAKSFIASNCKGSRTDYQVVVNGASS